jgi:hypothetical protein
MFGTSWTSRTALAHIEQIEAHDHALRLCRALSGDDALEVKELPLTEEMLRTVRRKAIDGFLLALRDGYVRATGRRSNTRGFLPRSDLEAWRLHATDPTLITTEEWREGEYGVLEDSLTGPAWQYIQIEVPDFMVKAIWPENVPEVMSPEPNGKDVPYSTPYLELMQAAIAKFGITHETQGKKECLLDWFLEQKVEGEHLSNKLADAMATLIRLPSSQRGGAKRVRGPDLRRAG